MFVNFSLRWLKISSRIDQEDEKVLDETGKTGASLSEKAGEIYKIVHHIIKERPGGLAMKLDDLLQSVHHQTKAVKLPEIRKIAIDSRKTGEGDLFIAVRGRNEDGHRFIPEALQRGAAAVLLDSPKYRERFEDLTTVIYVRDTRKAFSKLAAAYYGNPSHKMELIGVTGTNGKTSVTTIAHKTFQNLGVRSALIGTINNYVADREIGIETTTATTPDCLELQEILRHCCREQTESVLLEVSSIAMKNHRCDDLDFDMGVFLNLSREHMEDHGTIADYFASKGKLFSMAKKAVINSDDEYGRKLISQCSHIPVLTFGIWEKDQADLTAGNIRYTREGVSFEVSYQRERQTVSILVPCEFEIYNILAVLGICLMKGIPLKEAVQALPHKLHVAGRYEMIKKQDSPTVIVDYAHTPDALEKLLFSIRKSGRYQNILTVFGCGGDRDFSKRSTMGHISQQFSDFSVITSDNPRTEDPVQIIQDIEGGMIKSKNNYIAIADRGDAIRYALHRAQPQDVVVIAGKGHETYQIIGTQKQHFSDKEMVLRYLV